MKNKYFALLTQTLKLLDWPPKSVYIIVASLVILCPQSDSKRPIVKKHT